MDHLFTFGAIQLIDIIEHPKFFSCTQNQIDPLHFSDFFRLQLSITPRHHNSVLRISTETPPYTLPAFPIRNISHSTDIQHKNITYVFLLTPHIPEIYKKS